MPWCRSCGNKLHVYEAVHRWFCVTPPCPDLAVPREQDEVRWTAPSMRMGEKGGTTGSKDGSLRRGHQKREFSVGVHLGCGGEVWPLRHVGGWGKCSTCQEEMKLPAGVARYPFNWDEPLPGGSPNFKRKERKMIETLRTLVIDRIDLDEAVWLILCAQGLKTQYGECKLEAPDWLQERIDELDTTIKSLREDNLRKAEKDVENQLKKLASREEKKDELQKKLADIKAKRGG